MVQAAKVLTDHALQIQANSTQALSAPLKNPTVLRAGKTEDNLKLIAWPTSFLVLIQTLREQGCSGDQVIVHVTKESTSLTQVTELEHLAAYVNAAGPLGYYVSLRASAPVTPLPSAAVATASAGNSTPLVW